MYQPRTNYLCFLNQKTQYFYRLFVHSDEPKKAVNGNNRRERGIEEKERNQDKKKDGERRKGREVETYRR